MKIFPNIRNYRWYLAVVELLDDSFTLLADITDTNEFCLTMTLEETATNTLYHSSSRASTGNTAVLNVPEHTHWRDVLGTILWRTWHTLNSLSKHLSLFKYLKSVILINYFIVIALDLDGRTFHNHFPQIHGAHYLTQSNQDHLNQSDIKFKYITHMQGFKIVL